jgi:hypothetical protein
VTQPPTFPGDDTPSRAEEFPSFGGDSLGTGEQPLTTRHGGSGRGGGPANPWIVGLAVGAVLVAVSIIAFGLFAPADETDAAGSTTTTTLAGDDGTTTTAGGDDGTTTTAGGDDGTTTTTQPTGTTVTLPGDGDTTITPIGDPIPIEGLTMSSNDVGELSFGDDGDQVLGRLAATFGDPTQDTGFIVGNGAWGECPGDSIRVVQWGPFNVVVRGEPGASTFVSYRMDLRYGGITSPATDIATLSGLRVGDQVSQLNTIYAGFAIDFRVDTDLGLVFELRTARDTPLLLWGPVDSQEDTGLVTGIYSPDSCSS